MTILLWGRAQDPVVHAVAQACKARHRDAVVVESDEVTSFDLDGELVTTAGQRIDLARVTGVLVRPDSDIRTPDALRLFQAFDSWTELTAATVLNRPSAAASNRSKPYQLQTISDYGFAVPETLVTTDHADVAQLRARCGRLIYKSVSGTRSIVAEFTDAHAERLDDIATCPTQFQQYVPGVDVRVHVVGPDVFACRIESTATDYRYTGLCGATTTMAAVQLPAEIAQRCVRLADGLGLGLAGVDLRLDAEGRWWCFEVNTAPGFTWFEDHSGLPIAAAVARALAAPERSHPSR